MDLAGEIHALAVPGQKPVYGCGMAKIMEPGLITRAGFPMHPSKITHATKRIVDRYVFKRFSLTANKEAGRLVIVSHPLSALSGIIGEDRCQLRTDGNQTCLEEFCVPYGQEPLIQIDVFGAERQRLTDPQSRPVKKENESAECKRFQYGLFAEWKIPGRSQQAS